MSETPGAAHAGQSDTSTRARNVVTPELLRQREAAEFLGVSTRYLRYRADIPVVLLPGHGEKGRPLLRYRRSDLEAWIDAVNNPRSRKVSA